MIEHNVPNYSENQTTPFPYRIEVLTQEEQQKLIGASFSHQYGILIRLALFTGLETRELLGLQWNDIDICNSRLCIRHELTVEKDGFHICPASSPRYIPLFPHLLQDLTAWSETLENAVPISCRRCNSVAIDFNGQQINWGMLDFYIYEIARLGGVMKYDFEILRNTFAVRSLEHGMDIRTLSRFLGNHGAASIYACFAYGRICADMEPMEPLLPLQQTKQRDLTYPVVVRRLENEFTQIYAPNFPEFTMSGPVLTDGLIIMREKIKYRLRSLCYSPLPVPVSEIPCGAGECIIQISVKP